MAKASVSEIASFLNDCKFATESQMMRYFGIASQGGLSKRLSKLIKMNYIAKRRFGGQLAFFLTHNGYSTFINIGSAGYYRPEHHTMATVEHTFMETEFRIFTKGFAGMEWVYGSRDILKNGIKYGKRRPDGVVAFLDNSYALEIELSHKSASNVWRIRSKYNIELEKQRFIKNEPEAVGHRLKGVIAVGPNEYVLSKYMDPLCYDTFAVCLISDLKNCIYYKKTADRVKCRECGAEIKIEDITCPKCKAFRPAIRGMIKTMPLEKKLNELRIFNSRR